MQCSLPPSEPCHTTDAHSRQRERLHLHSATALWSNMIGIAHTPCCNPRVEFRAEISLQPICAEGREVHARKWDIDTFPVESLQSRNECIVLNAKIIAAATVSLGIARDATLLDFRQLITTCSSVVQYRWLLKAARGWMEVPRRTLSCRQGRRAALLVAGGANHCLTNIVIGLGIGRIKPEYQALPFCTCGNAISPQTMSSTLHHPRCREWSYQSTQFPFPQNLFYEHIRNSHCPPHPKY